MTDTSTAVPTEPEKTIYDELPDAPPKKRIRLSLTGRISVAVVAFWVLMAVFGPMLAPHDEAVPIEGRLQTSHEFIVTADATGPLKITGDMVTAENRIFIT